MLDECGYPEKTHKSNPAYQVDEGRLVYDRGPTYRFGEGTYPPGNLTFARLSSADLLNL